MNQVLKEKIKEALSAVLPITAIVLLLSVIVIPMSVSVITMFLIGAVLLSIGEGFFSLGADIAMTPMGESVGKQLVKSSKILPVVLISFFMGVIITMAEPDLDVLAKQVSAIPDEIMIGVVSVGVGAFLVLALLRIIFHIPLSRMLLICYGIVFLIALFVPKDFLSVAFDSGGVTTGPITVPFILAIGVGLSSMRKDKSSNDDSFGLVALCSIGPVLAVMLLGIIYNPQDATYEAVVIPELETMQDVAREFGTQFPVFAKEVFMALAPICIFFLLFLLKTRSFHKKQLKKIAVGIAYTFVGLVLFLTGVNVGFIPVGNLLGVELVNSSYRWLLVPVGMIIGYFIVAAEPAIHVLNKQIEDVSGGAIPSKAVQLCLSIGVAVSVGLSMIRVLTGISILWFLVPGYAIALGLSFFVPQIYTGIAFDSGGVASGPMTTTFLLPFAMGACQATGGNIMTDAFGVIALVAMTPLVAVQIMGLVFAQKQRKMKMQKTDIDDDISILLDGEEDE